MKMQGVTLVQKNLKKYGNDAIKKVAKGLEIAITEGEATAKHTASWQDRTGNARNSIIGSGSVIMNDRIRTALSIGVFYGKYLELCHFGKYRIIWPTLEWLGTRLKTHL